MKLAYFPEQMALQSEPVWRAFLEGCKKHGITPVENDINADAAVIWSVLWHGRLRPNYATYQHFRNQRKPVFIIEVGTLIRGITWKICVNHITSAGIYPQVDSYDYGRAKKLGLYLQPTQPRRRPAILLAGQHQYSHQWDGMPSVDEWLQQTINEIRQYTDRQIVLRPHPRQRIGEVSGKDVIKDQPFKLPNTYDQFNINFDYHCVVNYCSGPSVQSAIAGTPVICSQASLAYPVSMPMENIEKPFIPDRAGWFTKLVHTEWTVDEITQGIPQKYLLQNLTL